MARPPLTRAAALALGLLALGALGCAALAPRPEPAPPLRLAALAERGDAPRRASTRLLLDGLEADAAGRPEAALAQYERALQVDPNNPYAYLAVARHELAQSRPGRALHFLDRTEALLGEEGARGARAHLLGLRGAALVATGRAAEGRPLLEEARDLAPSAWGDARLDASELR